MIIIPPYRWWDVEDGGGWPPFWDYGLARHEVDAFGPKQPWPSEWNRRPHP